MGRPVRLGGSYLRFATTFPLLLLLSATLTHAIDENLTKGATNNHVFESGIWGETIDNLNGGLNLTIPLGPEYQVSADVSYQLRLAYSSKIWQLNASNLNKRSRSRLWGRGQAGLGFALHMGRHYVNAPTADCQSYEETFEDSTGAAHALDGDGGLFTTDGSYLKLAGGSPWRVLAPTGTKLILGHEVIDLVREPDPNDPSLLPACDQLIPQVDVQTNDYRGDYVTRMEGKDIDPNTGQAANWVDITYETQPGMRHLIRTITDAAGRTITFTNERLAGTDRGVVRAIDLPAFGGTTARYTFDYQVTAIEDPFVYEDPFPNGGDLSVRDPNNPQALFENIPLLRTVTFPHGYRMTFEYEDEERGGHNFGLLQARVLPTGARIEYDFRGYFFQHTLCRGTSTSTCQVQPKPGMPILSGDMWCQPILDSRCVTSDYPGTFGVEAKRLIVEPGLPPATWAWRRREFTKEIIWSEEFTLSNPWKVIATDPSGNDTVTWYHFTIRPPDPAVSRDAETNDPWWKNGMVHATAWFRGSSAVPANQMRWEEQRWEDKDYQPFTPHHRGHYRRIKESKVVYGDDAGRSSRTVNEDWDEYGHFRKVTEYGFDGTPYRVNRTGYNCDGLDPNGACAADPSRLANWILDTYTFSETADAAGRALRRSEYEFDTLGYLIARKDLLTIPVAPGTPNARLGQPGDVATLYCYEGHVGDAWCPAGQPGARNGQPRYRRATTFDAGGAMAADPNVMFEEVYTYQGPYLATRRNVGMAWLAEDRVVDPRTGLASLTRDPSGVETRFTYDLLGRLTGVIPDSVNGQEAPALLAYPDIRTTTLTQEVAPGNAIFSRFGFDGLGRLVRLEKRQSDGNLAAQATTYDAPGRKLFQSEWGDTTRGTTYDYTDPHSDPAAPAQDPFGRVRRTTTADGKVTRTDYAGLSSTVTVEGILGPDGPVSAQTFYGRDAFGRLTQVLSPRTGPMATPSGADALYEYDELDRLVQVKQEAPGEDGNPDAPRLQYRYFTYDALGRQTSAQNPESGLTRSLAYDPLGNLLEREDAAGNVLTYRYDRASRLTESRLTPPGGEERVVAQRTYDQAGIHYGLSAGKLTSAVSHDDAGRPAVMETRLYGGLNGRLSARRWRIAGWDPRATIPFDEQPELSMTLGYDALGLLSELVYPEVAGLGRTVANPLFTYGNGHLVGVSDRIRGVLVEALEYNPAGGVRRIVTRGGVETIIAPDERNRPASITVTGPPPPPPPEGGGGGPGGGGGVIHREEHAWLSSPARLIGQTSPPVTLFASGRYSYDGAGNITAIGDEGSPRDTFAYDAVNRLVKAAVVDGVRLEDLEWSYDPFGNMTLQRRTISSPSSPAPVVLENRFTVSPARNQIASYRTGLPGELEVAVRYDANGNLVEDKDASHTFDARNRLTEVYRPDGTLVARYSYDQDGYRVSKRDAATGTTTYYLRDLDGRVLSEFSRPAGPISAAVWSKDYVYAAGRHVALYENETPAPPGGLVSTASRPGETPFVNLSWARNADLDLLKYRVHREAVGLTEAFDHMDLGETSYYDASATPGVFYTYWLTAVDRAGIESAASERLRIVPGDPTDPDPPGGLAAAEGDAQVELTWTPPLNFQGDLLGYHVWRSDDAGATWRQKGGLFRQARVTDLSVENGVAYLYRVVSVDTAGRTSAPSQTASATPVDTTPPDAPQGLYGVAEKDPQTAAHWIRLSWRRPLAADVTGYEVYRADVGQLATSGEATVTDGGVAARQAYRYRVRAVDGAGNASAMSEEVTVLAADPTLPVPVVTRLGWDYACRGTGMICRLPHNFFRGCNSWGQCYYADALHENRRSLELDTQDPNAPLGGFRLYRRRGLDEPWELLRELPPPGESSPYPQFNYGTSSRYQQYHDFVPDPTDACGSTRYRVSALSESGDESGMSEEAVVGPALLAPENVMVPAESWPRDPNGSLVPDRRTRPEVYGMTLTWTSANATCGGSFRGYHVYRKRLTSDRWGVLTASTPQKPQIRLTRDPVDVPVLRVDYLPLDHTSGGCKAGKLFAGPAEYGLQNGQAIPHAVTAVDVFGNESAFSDPVHADAYAQQVTDACGGGGPAESYPCATYERNTEVPASVDFVVPDPSLVELPAAPGNFSWSWRYSRGVCPEYATDSAGPPRNWALVTWDIPAGAPNEYVLLRQTGADPTFHEVPLPMLAGDYGGIPQLVHALPLELACVDANYSVVAKDLFGRSGPISGVVSVPRYPLIPEDPRAEASGGQVTVSWDPLPVCGEDPGYMLTGYAVVRSVAAVASCAATTMPADPNAYTVIGTALETQRSLSAYTPPGAPGQAYWYRVRSTWSDACGESALSGGICLSADGTLQGSGLSAHTLVAGLIPPANLTVPAEPIDPNVVTNPAYHGLDLTWTAPTPVCGTTLKGFHVYRNRWDGTAYGGTPLRLTSREQPATGSSFRVDYAPIPSGHDPNNPTGADFTGPPGYRAGTELPPTYRLTAVSVLEEEGAFSGGVRAHANATTGTVGYQDPNMTGPMNELSGAATFAHADPADPSLVPGPPSGLSWAWFYGRQHATDIVPQDRNWAVVTWQAPQAGVVNDFHLLRRTASEPEFVEVPQTGFIPGDDLGVRRFVWGMPVELACEDADYEVMGVDIFGRSGAASEPLSVPRHRLVPEAPRLEQPGEMQLRMEWDPLPGCGQDPNHALREYVVMRSQNHVLRCRRSGLGPDTVWIEVGTVPGTQAYMDLPLPSGSSFDRYWYRVKARWGEASSDDSGESFPVCGSHRDGQRLNEEDEPPPEAELRLPGGAEPTSRLAAFSPAAADDADTAVRLAASLPRAPGGAPAVLVDRLDARADDNDAQVIYPEDVVAQAAAASADRASPHRLIGQVPSVNPAVRLSFYHLDHLGTPRVITDVSGQPVSKHKYLPFGEELSPPASLNTHRFTGHERDGETGLDYMLARYYSSSLDRFLSPDPSQKIAKNVYEPQRWNRYTYSLNNPIKFLDPDGRDAVTSVNPQTKAVTVTVNVVVAGGTAQQASKFQSDANAKWGGQSSFTAKDGSKGTLNVQVNATNDPSKFSAADKPNTVQVSDSGKSEMTSSNQGTLNSKDLENPNTAGHETGHMMGLGDQYNKETGQPNPGKEGSMMGDPKNPDAKPTQEEKDEVGNKALESVEKKDKKP